MRDTMSTIASGPSYRNQYLVARGTLDRPLGTIAAVPLGPVTLYPGPSLKWHFEQHAERWVLVIGEALATTAPERSNADIAGHLVRGCECRARFLAMVHDLAGRYVILHGDGPSAVAIADAMGQRQIYYGDAGAGLMLTSSPRMFFDCAGLDV